MKGIYKIENLINSKVYIGQTINVSERKNAHFEALRSKRHYNDHLQKSFDKYGEGNFSFVVIEETENLDEKEKYWISYYDSIDPNKGYNLTTGGKDFEMTEDIKNKISDSLKRFYDGNSEVKSKLSSQNKGENNPFYGKTHTRETIEKIIKKNKNFKHSDETKRKMSAARKGEKHPNCGKTFSEEWRRNLSEAHKGQKPGNKIDFSVEEVNVISDMFKRGETLKKIANNFDVSVIPIKRVLIEVGLYKQTSPRKPLTAEELKQAVELLNGGKSLNFVSKLFGLTSPGLKKKLIKNNLI